MKLLNKKLLLLFIAILLPLFIFAQRPSRKVRSAQRKADKKEIVRKEDYEKARKAKKKRHYEIQTKEVQDRMKQSKKEAERNNRKKKDPFLKRLFRKKRR